ncbi:serine hydrolase domain-containing protein [Pseudonocardia spinosispora]|uniref:serine hydrolase domain-containing protein n=1 Tax=Pseudonocardia spinosispora TaxID=103441 RepID=UPI0007E8E382|nr:serine hydrolase [Pseudonocardia spinosispora]
MWVRGRQCAVVAACVVAATLLSGTVASAAPGKEPKHCAVPTGSAKPETATPEEANFDRAALNRAVLFISSRNRFNAQIYRNNCLVAGDPINPLTNNAPMNIFSATKSVVSMVAGIAVTRHRLDLDAPIGRYLPAGKGDAAHRAITVRDLLNEASGIRQASVSELAPLGPVGGDLSAPDQALATPLTHRPGTYFEYSQRTPDLLVYVVQRAVGEDFQAFAQRELFAPLGIAAHDYYWQRDRSGNTYGHAWLYLSPVHFARLGLLMSDNGSWNGRRIIDADYVSRAGRSSTTNPCYGLLFWVNRGPCIGGSLPSRATTPAPFPGMFRDLYFMGGAAYQVNGMDPETNVLVTTTGVLGDVSLDPQTLAGANLHNEFGYNFLRLLNAAFRDGHHPDPGPYRQTYNFSIRPEQNVDPAVSLSGLGVGPYAPAGCNLIACGAGRVPTQGISRNFAGLLALATHR